MQKKTGIYTFQHLLATMWAIMFEHHDDTREVLNRSENWAISFSVFWQLNFRVGVILCNAHGQAAHVFIDTPQSIVLLAVYHNVTHLASMNTEKKE